MADDKPRKPAKSTNLNIRITVELRSAIERAAADDDRSVSQWVSLALKRVLAARKNSKLDKPEGGTP